jgi:hypothetical protein
MPLEHRLVFDTERLAVRIAGIVCVPELVGENSGVDTHERIISQK